MSFLRIVTSIASISALVGATAIPLPGVTDETTVVEVSINSLGTGAIMGTPKFSVDGITKGILPAKIRLTPTSGVRISVSGGDLEFNGVLQKTEDGFRVEPSENTHCMPFDGIWSTNLSGHTLKLALDVEKVGDWNCAGFPSIGISPGKGKLTFASDPVGATIYYPRFGRSDFLTKSTPATLVVDFAAIQKVSVIYKMEGFYDCSKEIRFVKEADGHAVLVDGVKTGVTTLTTSKAPKIECTLTSLSNGI